MKPFGIIFLLLYCFPAMAQHSGLQINQKLLVPRILYTCCDPSGGCKEYSAIQSIYDFLDFNPDISVRIECFSDKFTEEEKNIIFSRDSAEKIYQALIQKGIDSNRLSYQGMGNSEPKITAEYIKAVAKNEDEVKLLRDLNNRVFLVITYIKDHHE